MESLTATVEKYQNDKIATVPEEVVAGESVSAEDASALRKTVTDLREMVRFLRSEREMYEAQLESSRRTSERERAAAAVTKRSLDEARAELQILQNQGRSADKENAKSVGEREADATKIRKAEEQLVLLRESNKLLREEAEKTAKSLQAALLELDTKKKSAAPTEARCRQLEVDKAALEAEKESLAREVDAWKGRVQSLVSKFNTIDPEEHAQALARAEASKKECESLKNAEERSDKECASAKALVTRLNKEITQTKTALETAKTSLLKVTAEKAALLKKSSAAGTTSAKELLQLKETLKQREEELVASKGETEAASKRIDGLKNILNKMKQQSVELQKQTLAATAKQQEAERALEKEHEILKGKEAELAKAQSSSAALASAPAAASSTADFRPSEKDKALATKAAKAVASASSVVTSTDGSMAHMPRVPAGGFKFAPSVIGKSNAEIASKSTAQRAAARAASPAPAMAKQMAKPSFAVPALSVAAESSYSSKKGTESKFTSAAAAAAAAAAKEAELNAMREKLKRKKKRHGDSADASTNPEDDKTSAAPPKKRVAKTSELDKPDDAKLAESEEDATVEAPSTLHQADEDTAVDKKEDGASELKDESKVDVDSSEVAPSSGFGFGKTTGGSSSVFGGGISPAFGSGGGFGSAAAGGAGGAPMFGSSNTVFSDGRSAAGFGDVGGASGDGEPGGSEGKTFLDIKPPGSSAPGNFFFGSSASITLPMPKSTSSQPAPTSGFGAFGRASGVAKVSPFGSAALSSNGAIAFGSSTTTKRPSADDDKGTESVPQESRAANEEEGDEAEYGEIDE